MSDMPRWEDADEWLYEERLTSRARAAAADQLAQEMRTVLDDIYCGCESCELWAPPLRAALAAFDAATRSDT